MTAPEKLQKLIGNLNPTQALVLPALRWLLNPKGGFRGGRTHLIAVVILEAAIHNPGCEVPMFDHGPSGSKRIVEETVKTMIEEVLKCPEDFVFVNDYLLYEPCEK